MVGLGGLFECCFRKALIKEACLCNSTIFCGVLGVKTLDLLLGQLPGGVGIREDIFNFESTRSALTGTKPVAAKLF